MGRRGGHGNAGKRKETGRREGHGNAVKWKEVGHREGHEGFDCISVNL